MPNETQIECYFKSADLLKVCQAGKDVVINIKTTYSPGENPTFTISAAPFKKSGKSVKALQAMPLGDGSGSGGATGCPAPCK